MTTEHDERWRKQNGEILNLSREKRTRAPFYARLFADATAHSIFAHEINGNYWVLFCCRCVRYLHFSINGKNDDDGVDCEKKNIKIWFLFFGVRIGVDTSVRDASKLRACELHDLLANIRYTKVEHTTILPNQYLTHTEWWWWLLLLILIIYIIKRN